MSCVNYNCDPLAEQVLNVCGVEINGSAAEVVIFECGSEPADASDGTAIAAQIVAGTAVIAKKLMVEFPEGSAVEGGNYIAGGEPKPTTYQRTATWIDTNVNTTSQTFYNAVDAASGVSVGAILCKLVEQDLCLYIVPNVSGILFKGTLTGSDSEPLRYSYIASWKNKLNPTLVAEPAGVFS
jgi:hypothetical protein